MTDEEKIARIAQLRTEAADGHRMGDRKWEMGKKDSSQSYHNQASACTKEANELEATLPKPEPVKPPGPGMDSIPMRACAKCKEATRGAEEPHHVLPGALTIHVFHRPNLGPSPRDHTETKRYCPRCTPVVQDALMELGFTFLKKDEDPPVVIHLNPVIEGLENAAAALRPGPTSIYYSTRTGDDE